MKARALSTMLVLCILLTSCIESTPKSSVKWSSEQELREAAHELSCITVNEFVNYEHDFVYEKELPSFLLIERTVLEDICKKTEIKGFDKINWVGDGSIDGFEYYAVFNCNSGPDVFTAYLGVNEETAKHIYDYISPKGDGFVYFYSPFMAVIDGVSHKKSLINKQYKVKGELLYLFEDKFVASEWLKEKFE